MKINNITFNKKGSVINFATFNTVNCGDMFLLEHNNKNYYFSAENVSCGIVSDSVVAIVTATEIGYFGRRIKAKQVNIKEILGSLLRPVTDEEIIKKIEKESLWL